MIDIGADLQRAFDDGYEKGKEDRPQGENTLSEYKSLFRCSLCGAGCNDTYTWDCEIRYCPNCGARVADRRKV